MKSSLINAGLVCTVFILSTACKKQVTEKSSSEIDSATPSQPSNCNYTGIGFSYNNGSTAVWKNILLRWFDEVGRVKNIKIKLAPYQSYSSSNVVNIDYGEVIYNTGTIRLKDVYSGQEVLRATMNVTNTRPIISWYDGHSNHDYPQYDTSYYTYDGTNRIKSIEQHARFEGATGSVATWNFEYDPAGNLVTIKPAGSYGGYEFRYDYTQLDSGIATIHYLSPATKVLEFMGLLKFEYHHKLASVIRYEPSGYPSLAWGYINTEKNSRGNITVYSTDYSKWFTAWNCSGTSQLSSKNPTKEEFMKMVH